MVGMAFQMVVLVQHSQVVEGCQGERASYYGLRREGNELSPQNTVADVNHGERKIEKNHN